MSTPPPDRVDSRADPRADTSHRFGPTRARVLDAVRDLAAPATAAEVAARLGTHPNTARFHLEALVGVGVVSREREERTAPGRPRTHYVAAATGSIIGPATGSITGSITGPGAGAGAGAGGTQRSYRLLAEILATHLDSSAPDPAGEAVSAGRRFGRTAAPAGERPQSVAAAAGLVVDTLARMGFESQPTPEQGSVRIDVTTCPFLEVATRHLDVVCAIHRGLMEGLLETADAPAGVASLEPLVEPSHCVARLTSAPTPAPASAR